VVPDTCTTSKRSPRVRAPSIVKRGRPGSISLFPPVLRWALAGLLSTSVLLVLLAALGSNVSSRQELSTPVPGAADALLEGRLPMEVNARVDYWIRRFLSEDRESFEAYLMREGLYGGIIRGQLQARGMPEELLYLAMIESGFSPSASSPVSSAGGLWQFLGATARSYGLAVDYWVDERRDPIRATDAALDYLEELYGELGSWYLAAAAYNAGPLRVQEALRRSGASAEDGEEIYWKITEHLPRQTSDYVPKILAATLLAEQREHFGIEVEVALPYLFDQVLVPAGTPLTTVARALDLPPALIRELNPHLIRGVTPPGRSFPVRIPLGESQRLVVSLAPGMML